MSIKISRHAQRQMKWRKISEDEMKSAIGDPDMEQASVKGRRSVFKALGGRLLKVTCCRENKDIIIGTAVIKGE